MSINIENISNQQPGNTILKQKKTKKSKNIIISNDNMSIENYSDNSKKKKTRKKNIKIETCSDENNTCNSKLTGDTKSTNSRRKRNDDLLIEKLITPTEFIKREREYYNILYNFYLSLKDKELKTIHNIVNEKGISLRKFEWFAVRYSYYYKTSVNVNNRFMDSKVYVHISYKAHLKTYHKIFFDIFRRSDKNNKSRKFLFTLPDRDFSIVTSISQLHFMRWILTHGIIDYVTENYDDIIEKEDTVDAYFNNRSERSRNSKSTKSIKSLSNSSSVIVKRKIQFEV